MADSAFWHALRGRNAGKDTQVLKRLGRTPESLRIVLTRKPYTGLVIPGTEGDGSTGFLLWMIRPALLISR
jgi:hypothetical protein